MILPTNDFALPFSGKIICGQNYDATVGYTWHRKTMLAPGAVF